jgi:hypothetical protein
MCSVGSEKMDEIGNYLSTLKYEIILQEICENNRSKESHSAPTASHDSGEPSTRRSSWTDSLTNFTSYHLSPSRYQYSGAYLRKKNDPSHWTSSNGVKIESMNHVLIPNGYGLCLDWKIMIESGASTDVEGWQYNQDFVITGWTIHPNSDCHVRHRKWQRLLIKLESIQEGKRKVHEFTSLRREFRSFNPQLIYCALKNSDYQIQYVLECQRLSRPSSSTAGRSTSATISFEESKSPPTFYQETPSLRNNSSSLTSSPNELSQFSELHLLPTDPSQWSIASPSLYPLNPIASLDPTTLPPSHLTDAYPFLYSNPNGRNSLHEFIFTLYPNKDSQGWEYQTDFHQPSTFSSNSAGPAWYPSHNPHCLVRRRLWFRTLVPIHSLQKCRQLLSSYIANHPRGLCHQGALQRMSQYRKRWTHGIAKISNSSFSIELQNNYQKNYQFSLLNCEVQPIDSLQDLEKYLSSSASSSASPSSFKLSDWNEIVGSASDPVPQTSTRLISTDHSSAISSAAHGAVSTSSSLRTNLFCLCSLNSSGQYTGIQTILNAPTPQDRSEWICLLSHQIALYNLSFWSLPYSPPLVDTVVYQGSLWKLGHIVPNWKLRRFELTQLGVLSYYSQASGQATTVSGNSNSAGNGNGGNGHRKGRVRLRGCQVEWFNGTNGIRNEIILKKFNGYELVLRGENAQEMSQWMNELKAFTGLQLEDDKQQLFPTFATSSSPSSPSSSFPPSLPPSLLAPPPQHEILYDESFSALSLPPQSSEYFSLSNLQAATVLIPGIVTSVEEEPPMESIEVSAAAAAATKTLTDLFPEEELPPPASVDIAESSLRLSTSSPPLVSSTQTLEDAPALVQEEKFDEEFDDEGPAKEEEEEILSEQQGQGQDDEEGQKEEPIQPLPVAAPPADVAVPGRSNPSSTFPHLTSQQTQPESQPSAEEQEEGAVTPSIPTHELTQNQRGRRVSLLNSSVLETAVENARWGGSDSDESDGEASSRSSSFAMDSSIGGGDAAARPLSLLRPQREQSYPPPSVSSANSDSSSERTHEVTTTQQGRRVSVLNSVVLQEATVSAVWGGNDSDESDGESTRGSSFSDSSSFGENRPLSLRPVSSSSSSAAAAPESTSPPLPGSLTEEPEASASSGSRTFSSMFGFGFNRRRSL